jgi:hypothetical protein
MAWLLWVAGIALVLSPRKYDPAIRLKEYAERKRDDQSYQH